MRCSKVVLYKENKHEPNFKMSMYPYEKLELGGKKMHHTVYVQGSVRLFRLNDDFALNALVIIKPDAGM